MEKSALLLAELKTRRDQLTRLIDVMEGASKEARGGKYAHPAVVPKKKIVKASWLKLEADIERFMGEEEAGDEEGCWASSDVTRRLMLEEEYAFKGYINLRNAVLKRLRAMEKAGYVEFVEKLSTTHYYRLAKK